MRLARLTSPVAFVLALALAPVACSSGGGDDGGGEGGEGGEGAEGGEGGAGGGGKTGGKGGSNSGNGGATAGSGGGSGGDAGNAGGQGGGNPGTGGGAPGDVPYLSPAISKDGWGEPYKITVPAGVMVGMTPILTTPKLATGPIPAYSGMSRTMNLLRTSTAQKRNKVKIVFYGQSITRQEWYVPVIDYLKQTYPNADIEAAMWASGGLEAAKMRRASEHDILPYYPDLVVYYNFGSYPDIDGIVGDWRTRTTAEVILQNWHVGSNGDNPGVERMSYIYVPDVATRQGAELIDQRTPWKAAAGGNFSKFLSDGIHLNQAGIDLMAKIVIDYFKAYPANTVVDPLKMVSTYNVGEMVKWNGGKLVADFEGNRIDVIAMSGANISAGAADVLIDGKKPSEHEGAYAFTKPNYDGKLIDKPEPGWPWRPENHGPLRVDHNAKLVVEDWTITTSGNSFTIRGSVTGDDGMGSISSKFTSKSGRVVIDGADWWLQSSPSGTSVPATVKWKAIALHTDTYPPQAVAATDSKIEYATTLVQGIPNAKHRLEIISKNGQPLPIAAVRVFRPPLKR